MMGKIWQKSYRRNARAVVSYANQDVEQIPVSQISQKTGVDTILLTDYESREAYQTVRCPYYNLAGWPIENGLENQLYLMNGYRVVGAVTYENVRKKFRMILSGLQKIQNNQIMQMF